MRKFSKVATANNKIVYTHGHAAAVVQNHATRTCEEFAGHVVRMLGPGDSLLDVGCGPASITKGKEIDIDLLRSWERCY